MKEVIEENRPTMLFFEPPEDGEDQFQEWVEGVVGSSYVAVKGATGVFITSVSGENNNDDAATVALGTRSDEFACLVLEEEGDGAQCKGAHRHALGLFQGERTAGWTPLPHFKGSGEQTTFLWPHTPTCSGGSMQVGADDLPERRFETEQYIPLDRGVYGLTMVNVFVLHPQPTILRYGGYKTNSMLIASPSCGAVTDCAYYVNYDAPRNTAGWSDEIAKMPNETRKHSKNRLWLYPKGNKETKMLIRAKLLYVDPDRSPATGNNFFVHTSLWLMDGAKNDLQRNCAAGVIINLDSKKEKPALIAKCIFTKRDFPDARKSAYGIRAFLQLPLPMPHPMLPYDDMDSIARFMSDYNIQVVPSPSLPTCTQTRVLEFSKGGALVSASALYTYLNRKRVLEKIAAHQYETEKERLRADALAYAIRHMMLIGEIEAHTKKLMVY